MENMPLNYGAILCIVASAAVSRDANQQRGKLAPREALIFNYNQRAPLFSKS